jgi:hypothetical protein
MVHHQRTSREAVEQSRSSAETRRFGLDLSAPDPPATRLTILVAVLQILYHGPGPKEMELLLYSECDGHQVSSPPCRTIGYYKYLRALYIIRWHILDHVPRMSACEYKSPGEWWDNPHEALDSVTNTETRTAATQSDLPLELINALPPSCWFGRAALQHIGDSGDKSKVWGIDDGELRKTKKKLEDRWDFR